MAKMDTYTQKGVKQQLSDIVTMISPEETPFQTLIGSGSTGGTLFNWTEDKLRAAKDNAAVEGADAGVGTAVALQERMNYTQIFEDVVNVTGSAATNQQAGKDELARQRENVAKALKLDIEHAYVGTGQTAAAGSSSTARKTAGYQAQIDAANTLDKAAAAVTEDDIADMLVTLYEAGAKPDTLMMAPRLKREVSKSLNALKQSDIGNSGEVNFGVSVYMSDFGTVKIVPNRSVKYDATTKVGDILVVDPTMWEQVIYRDWNKESLAKTGDSIKEQMLTERGLKNRNFSGSGLITNVKAGA